LEGCEVVGVLEGANVVGGVGAWDGLTVGLLEGAKVVGVVGD
jgi:hypothetical protein